MRKRLVAFAALGLLAACGEGHGPDGSSSPEDLLGRAFASTGVMEQGEARDLAGGRIVLEFQERDGVVSARWEAGCNISSGEFDIEPDRLVPQPEGVSGFPSTEMGCTPEHHEDDGWVGGVFADAPAWTLDGESLVLTTEAVEIELIESIWRRG